MTSPWKPAGAPASSFSLGNHVGQLLFICVGGVHEDWPLSNTTAPAVRANVIAVESGFEQPDAMMFAVKVIAQLRNEAGNVVLGRVVAEKGRGNNDMYSINPELTPQDEQWAQYWVQMHPGRLEELQRLAVAMFQAEEARRNGGSRTGTSAPAAAPPPPPPPAAPPQPPAAQPAYAPPAPPSGPPTPPAAPAPPWTPTAHITGGPPQPGDTSTPPY